MSMWLRDCYRLISSALSLNINDDSIERGYVHGWRWFLGCGDSLELVGLRIWVPHSCLDKREHTADLGIVLD